MAALVAGEGVGSVGNVGEHGHTRFDTVSMKLRTIGMLCDIEGLVIARPVQRSAGDLGERQKYDFELEDVLALEY